MKTEPCRYCGASVVWATLATGAAGERARICLDARAEVFNVAHRPSGEVRCSPTTSAMPRHRCRAAHGGSR